MKLLIADDHRDAAETLAELLRLVLPPPVEIVLAFDGREALDAATTGQGPPDALITDIEMPRMNGINAAIAIRSALGGRAPKLIIAMTGHGDKGEVAAASGAFDHVLLKPVDMDELLRLLRPL
jgi:CheY-like chemotaxis protein